jgi:predicted component of type VI protein secretion system
MSLTVFLLEQNRLVGVISLFRSEKERWRKVVASDMCSAANRFSEATA